MRHVAQKLWHRPKSKWRARRGSRRGSPSLSFRGGYETLVHRLVPARRLPVFQIHQITAWTSTSLNDPPHGVVDPRGKICLETEAVFGVVYNHCRGHHHGIPANRLGVEVVADGAGHSHNPLGVVVADGAGHSHNPLGVVVAINSPHLSIKAS